jgi:NAD(P)H-dependent flavin oxidoreductase YrpB (nitropropane dioxygenase family)
MKLQTLSDLQPTPDTGRPAQSESMARRINRQQIQALLDVDTTVTSRRSVVAAGLAVGAQAALAATSVSAIAPVAASPSLGLNTRLTREYGVRFPFVGAGMGFVATPALVAAVSNAGGIGVFGNGIEPPPSTQTLIQQIKLKTSQLFGVDFIHDDSAFGPLTTDAHINVCIADGGGVFRALAGGAEGVWVGTRLVASTEADASAQYKARIIAAKEGTTVTTTMFGPEYPNRPYRVLRNRVVDEFAGHEDSIPDPAPPPAIIGKTLLFPLTFRQPYEMPKFSAIVPTPDTVGDFEEMGMPAGDGAALIKTIMPAAQIVATMMHDARRLFESELAGSRGGKT